MTLLFPYFINTSPKVIPSSFSLLIKGALRYVMALKSDEVRERWKKKLEAVDIRFLMSRLPTIYGLGLQE